MCACARDLSSKLWENGESVVVLQVAREGLLDRISQSALHSARTCSSRTHLPPINVDPPLVRKTPADVGLS